MIRKFEFTDILGWSHSRYNTFSSCERRYYYTYYAKRWDEPSKRLKLGILRDLTSVALEIGNITHKIIHDLLKRLQKSSEPIDKDRFEKYVRAKALKILEGKTFQEIYYEETDEIDLENQILNPVFLALTNFIESKRFQWLIDKAILSKDDWYLPSENDADRDFGECRIDGMKAYCKVDCLFPVGGELVVIDWKTGKMDDYTHQDQLKGYSTWAAFHFGKNYQEIKPVAAYLLPSYSEVSLEVTAIDIKDFTEQIRRQTDEMYEFCEDKDLNIPLAKSEFYLTDNTRICDFCNYRESCDRV